MGKNNKSNKGKGGKVETKQQQCKCDHPYQCNCGNRPERPSRGHKWDPTTQTWGGKGHKQKGGSGQTASVAQEAKVTEKGNTVLKQWQKLPSKLLCDLCKKNGKALGKGLPIYRPVNNRGIPDAGGDGKKKYRYRLIIPDTSKKKGSSSSSSDHDIVLTPTLSVSNEEQAKEEAALLGLLYLFPKLPHERTLPEPYRSTFLAALKNNQNDNNDAAATPNKDGNKNDNDKKNDNNIKKQPTTTSNQSDTGATANTQLTANLPSFHLKNNNNMSKRDTASTSSKAAAKSAQQQNQPALLTRAQINEAKRQHQREVQSRIRKHEAIRNANKPMEVFMSARFRKRIECLLSGNVFDEEEDDDYDNDEGFDKDIGEDNEEDVLQSYVHQRLVHEGFSSKQVTKAYREVMKKKKTNNATKDGNQNEYDDQTMDKVYDETLQYLCIHLNEDQLPIGFDPRGGTLDVVRPTATGEKTKQKKNEKKRGGEEAKDDDVGASYDTNILQFAEYFGLTPREAFAICSSDKNSFSSTTEELAMKRAFWKVIGDAASLPISRTCFGCDSSSISDEDKVMNKESAANEREALEAIFEEGEFSINQYEDRFTRVAIALPFGGVDEDTKLSLEVHYVNGLYPSLLPMVFVTSGNLNGRDKSNKKYQFGGRLHLKIAKYLKESINAGQEVIFELFGELQSMLQKEEEEPSASLDGAEVSELLSHLKLDSGIVSNDSNNSNDSGQTQSKTNDPAKKSNEDQDVEGQIPRKQQSKPLWRPRERATFWNTKPSKTPPAECFPKLGPLLEHARKSLPAAKAKKDFISLMSDAKKTGGRVVLVTGETGCGKTTQVPQFILEEAPLSKIIVAQPRRLAATGVASRVALERGESEPGKASVGYVVRGDSKICGSTRLMFCTTGVLLRQLQAQNALENITHILVDEVHERHLDTDVLLAILKNTLPSLPNLTVVLMSATMDADRFAKYWGTSTPRIHIPGFTHPVQDFTLEDVLEMTNYIPPKKKKQQSQYSRGGRAAGGGSYQIQPSFVDGEELGDDDGRDSHIEKNSSKSMACAVPLEERLKRMSQDEIDYDLIALLIQTILQTKDDDGSMLVFLPGAGEIDRAERVIQSIVRGHAVMILPLHGGLQPEKQQQVFVPARKGCCKIILSTNVAETSITIPDCTIVIDTCKEKKSSFDPVNRMPLLLECYASRDSLKQRRGRAGRVRPGTCYKLISSSKHNKLPEHGEPEIRRCALDQTLLSLMFLGLENGSGSFLELMLDPPSEQSIQSALYSLEKTGALTRGGDQAFLTPLGTHLSGIPAPPVVGKLLVMGCLLGCRDMAVAVAAGLSAGRNPFLRINTFNNNHNGKDSIEQEKEQYKNNMILEARADLFKTVGKSDHAMLGKAFLLWKECKGHSERRKYCDKMGLAFNSMRDILALTRQLDSSLTTSGFLPSNHCNRNETSWRIVRSMLVASLSPTQTVRVQKPSTKYTETIEGAVEKDGKAKELKFFIRGGGDDDNQTTNNVNRNNEERVFIHPSSNNFAVGSYSCPWLVYHRLVRTSKAFVSDATECNSYSLLLFGGSMEVQASRGLIVLDDWIRLSANARIGSLIGGLRQKVDELLDQKVADPSLDITDSIEMKLITDLLRHDGV